MQNMTTVFSLKTMTSKLYLVERHTRPSSRSL